MNSDFSEVLLAHAGDDCESENLKVREGLRRFDGGAKDCRASRRMDSDHGNAKASCDRDGARHRIGYFVELEIKEHLLSLTHKPPNDRRALGSEQLEAHFVRCGSSAKLFDKCLGFRFTAEVQRDDDRSFVFMLATKVRGVTAMMPDVELTCRSGSARTV